MVRNVSFPVGFTARMVEVSLARNLSSATCACQMVTERHVTTTRSFRANRACSQVKTRSEHQEEEEEEGFLPPYAYEFFSSI